MDAVGSDPPKFGVVPVVKVPPDLVDLLTATKVINREICNRELSPFERVSVRFVLDELLGVALEIVAGGNNELPLFSSYSVFDDLPY